MYPTQNSWFNSIESDHTYTQTGHDTRYQTRTNIRYDGIGLQNLGNFFYKRITNFTVNYLYDAHTPPLTLSGAMDFVENPKFTFAQAQLDNYLISTVDILSRDLCQWDEQLFHTFVYS